MSHAQGPAEATPETASLSERDRSLLDFEREWWKYAGAKDVAVRDRFAMTPTDYYLTLHQIVDHDAAVEHDPLLVRRLRRQRLARQHQRSARRLDRAAPTTD